MIDRYPTVWTDGQGVRRFNCPCCGLGHLYPVPEPEKRVFRDCLCGARLSALKGELVLEREAVEHKEPTANHRYTHKDML